MAAVPPLTVDLDLFTDEEVAALLADTTGPVVTVPGGVEYAPDPADEFADGEDVFDGDEFDPFAEPVPGDDATALAGRDGDRAGALLAGSCRAGREVLGELVRAAAKRLLDDDDWGSVTTLFTDDELTRLRDSIAAVRANGDLLGRARVRRLAALAGREPTAVPFAEGYAAFECPRCGATMYDGDPARQVKYALSALCEDCGHRCPQKGLTPAVQRFAEPPPEGPFDVFDDDALPVQPPDAAVTYFRRLVPDISVRRPERYAPLFDREAFTLAVSADRALLDRVKGVIADALEQGGSRATVANSIEDLLRAAGVHPQNPQYADLVYRTNAMDAYVQGQQAEYSDPRMQEAFPAWEYHAVPDERARPHHAARDGLLYPNALTFQEVRGTDAGNIINCLPPWATISGRITAVLKARYTGELVEVLTAGGVRLAMTINHPVLTAGGPVPAGSLRKGDDLLRYRPQAKPGASADVQDPPARIEDLFNSFAAGPDRPAVTGLDFDGDGAFMQGQIEVVRPTLHLAADGDTGQGEGKRQVVLVSPDAGRVGRADLPTAGGRAHARPLDPLGVAPPPGRDTEATEAVRDDGTADAELLGQPVDRPAALEQSGQYGGVQRAGHRSAHVGSAAELDVRLTQPPADGLPFDPEFAAQLLGRFAGKVSTDQVVEVVRFHYDGPVYDVETEVGYFTASSGTQESIITRNCRCSWSPVHRRELERRIAAGETIQEG